MGVSFIKTQKDIIRLKNVYIWCVKGFSTDFHDE